MASSSDLADAVRRCKLRATPARLAILRILRAATAPLSHQDVVVRLGALGRDRTTVYRNLHQLTDARLLQRVSVGDRLYRFVAIDGHAGSLRAEFVCSVCGRIEQLNDTQLITPRSGPRAITLAQIELRVHGPCNDCL